MNQTKPSVIIVLSMLACLAVSCTAEVTLTANPTNEFETIVANAVEQTLTPPIQPTETDYPTPTDTSEPPTLTMTPAPEETWDRYEFPDAGFALSLPSGWLEYTDHGLENVFFYAFELVEGFEMYEGGEDVGGMPVDIQVQTMPTGTVFNSLDSLARIRAQNLNEQLESGQIQELISQERLTLPCGLAEQFTYRAYAIRADSDERVAAFLVEYMMVSGETLYWITMRTPIQRADEALPLFDEIAQTFQFTK